MKAMKKITKIWFDGEHIFGEDEQGIILKQSLLWYPKLKDATDEERAQYTTGLDGFHWRALDEDVSFESFEYEDAEPSVLELDKHPDFHAKQANFKDKKQGDKLAKFQLIPLCDRVYNPPNSCQVIFSLWGGGFGVRAHSCCCAQTWRGRHG